MLLRLLNLSDIIILNLLLSFHNEFVAARSILFDTLSYLLVGLDLVKFDELFLPTTLQKYFLAKLSLHRLLDLSPLFYVLLEIL